MIQEIERIGQERTHERENTTERGEVGANLLIPPRSTTTAGAGEGFVAASAGAAPPASIGRTE
jgi:hypothetical protein